MSANIPIRLRRSRKKGARLVSPNGLPVVCVTRPGKFGNPFKGPQAVRLFRMLMEHKDAPLRRLLKKETRTSDDVNVITMVHLQMYRHNIEQHLDDLRGKNLACYCQPGPCHADVLLEIANGAVKA